MLHTAPWGEVFEWRLPKLMAASGLRFATQLREMIASEGIDLSYSHVARLIQRAPERLTVDVQLVLCRVLNCTASDLWQRVDDVGVQPKTDHRQQLKAIKPVRARGLE